MKIGVLALQGAFAEHIAILQRLGAEALPVRLPGELKSLDGLVIPGGESTTISKLMSDYGLSDEVIKRGRNGLPILGTCAGMILMATTIPDSSVQPLGLMEMTVSRNAFGRQVDSFEAQLPIPAVGENPFPGVFIRAPLVNEVANRVTVMARLENGSIVAVRQGKLLACAFHPELTADLRFHQYFLALVAGNG